MSDLLCEVAGLSTQNFIIILLCGIVLIALIILCVCGIAKNKKKNKDDDKKENYENSQTEDPVNDNKEVPETNVQIEDAPVNSAEEQKISEKESENIDNGNNDVVEKKDEKEKEKKMKKNNVEKEVIVETANDKKQVVGKWIVIKKADKEYLANLKASNGQIVLTSESYSTDKSALAGIQTIKDNIAADNFQVYKDKKDRYFYKLKDKGNRLLCIGEVYNTKARCLSAIESVKRFAENSVIVDGVVEEITMIHYQAPVNETIEDETKIKDQYRGRWDITKDEEGLFSATLKASNGQILLNTERYKSISSVKSAIENYKDNSKANNFIIDIDKTGKYYYKLRNAQKLTLAVGETYNTQKDCESAIESFKRFNRIAKIYDYEESKSDKK